MLNKNYIKYLLLLLFLLLIFNISCNNNSNIDIEDEFIKYCDLIEYNEEINNNYQLDKSIEFLNDNINIYYEIDDENILKINNYDSYIELIPNKKNINQYTNLYIKYSYLEYEYERFIPLTILKYSEIELMDMVYKTIDIPNNINSNINLITSFPYSITGYYESSNEDVLTNNGIYETPDEVCNIVLTLHLSLNGVNKDYDFNITSSCYSNIDRLNDTMNNFMLPRMIYSDLILNDTTDYDIKLKYISSDESILTNKGVIKKFNKDVRLKVIFERKGISVEKEYMIKTQEKNNLVLKKDHQILYRIDDFNNDNNNYHNIIKENDYLTLDGDNLEGYYISDEISTHDFNQVIGSFAGKTDEKSTVELMISTYVDNKWSTFASYNPWGLNYNNNHTSVMNDGIIKMSEDEIIVLNNKYATKVKFKIVLRKANIEASKPQVRLVSLCLWFKNDYKFDVDTSLLPKEIKNLLNKNIVPQIGGVICSATSSCMLLKYAGENFKDKDTFEHRYISGLVYDKGAKIYGNWVFNCNTIAAFGHTAYAAIFYNLEELMYHLAYVGPVALSIRGTMVSEYRTYTTNGHLIVCTGYINDNGNIKFYIKQT